MGLHLTSGALNQAALARDRARAAAACWLLAAVVFVGWMLTPAVVHGQLLRAEIGYAGATGAAGGTLDGALPARHALPARAGRRADADRRRARPRSAPTSRRSPR